MRRSRFFILYGIARGTLRRAPDNLTGLGCLETEAGASRGLRPALFPAQHDVNAQRAGGEQAQRDAGRQTARPVGEGDFMRARLDPDSHEREVAGDDPGRLPVDCGGKALVVRNRED